MEDAWVELKRGISLANRLNKTDGELAEFHSQLNTALHSAVTRCRVERKRKLAEAPELDLSDECVLRAARFTDHLPLANYGQILHLTPRLVNVVTLAEAVPIPGSGVTLPLDLHTIAARCTNAYYAPRRFAAVQLAFSNPRCRVLIFREPRATSNHARTRTRTRLPAPPFPMAPVGRHGPTRRHRLFGADAGAHGHPQGGAAAGDRGQRARAHTQVQRESNFVSNMHTPSPQHLVLAALRR